MEIILTQQKNQQKTPKKQHSHDQSIIIHREISSFFLWLRGLLLKSRKYFKQTTTCIDYWLYQVYNLYKLPVL